MKTKILKLSCFAILLFTFFGCNDCSKCEKDNEALQNQLDLINQNATNEVQNDNESLFLNLKRYQVKGGFSTITGTIHISIPVTDSNLRIAEPPVNISSSNYNAILIRIDDALSDQCTNESPITNIISETYSIENLKLNEDELKKDGELIVIVLNNDTTDLADLIKGYKDSIKNLTNYKIESCLINNCNKYQDQVQPDDFKPKEDGGDIIIGG